MKRFLCVVTALVCALGLTACGSDSKQSAFDQQKISQAEYYATEGVIPVMELFMNGSVSNLEASGIYWDDYTMDEISYVAGQIFGLPFEVDGYGFRNAITSFTGSVDELGQIVSVGETQTRIDGLQIIVDVEVQGEKRSGSAEIIFSNDVMMKLESASLNPEYSMGEKMGKAGLNTIIGISSVFIVLILISLVISLFGFIPKIEKALANKKAAKNAATTGIDNAVAQIVASETSAVSEEASDEALIAVIAAAIAAYEGTTTDGFVVRSIRKSRR